MIHHNIKEYHLKRQLHDLIDSLFHYLNFLIILSRIRNFQNIFTEIVYLLSIKKIYYFIFLIYCFDATPLSVRIKFFYKYKKYIYKL